jgi:hypothetical protein
LAAQQKAPAVWSHVIDAWETDSSERVIPLVGVSLDAFRAFPSDFPRYADNPSLSDTINKFLRENELLETEGNSLYCLRHSFGGWRLV